MQIKFNYRYYIDEEQNETYQLQLTKYLRKKIAYHIEEVGEVVRFAETHQNNGDYVALYLPYEAATYFNSQMQLSNQNLHLYMQPLMYLNKQKMKGKKCVMDIKRNIILPSNMHMNK